MRDIFPKIDAKSATAEEKAIAKKLTKQSVALYDIAAVSAMGA